MYNAIYVSTYTKIESVYLFHSMLAMRWWLFFPEIREISRTLFGQQQQKTHTHFEGSRKFNRNQLKLFVISTHYGLCTNRKWIDAIRITISLKLQSSYYVSIKIKIGKKRISLPLYDSGNAHANHGTTRMNC